jgi:hypothetical protein
MFPVAIVWPAESEFFAPRTKRSGVLDCVIPNNFGCGEWMIKTKIATSNPWPMVGEVAMVNGKFRLFDRKYATRTQAGHSSRPRVPFMGWVTGNDLRLLLVGKVIGVVDCPYDVGSTHILIPS